DATRLEAALRLWGNDMDETVNPYEAGLGWTVKLDKGDFVGRDALQRVKAAGPRRKLIGLKTEPGNIARHGAVVKAQGKPIGVITSGTHSVFLELPAAGRKLAARETFGVIESVKAASDLYAPVAGRITEVNEKLASKPELINSDPYGEGWILKLELAGELPPDLIDESDYKKVTEAAAS